MCNIIAKIVATDTLVRGFKVVLRRTSDKRYFSPATGIMYSVDKPISIPIKQKKLTTLFDNNLLNPNHIAYEAKMKGFTAFFDSKDGANAMVEEMLTCFVPRNYKICIIECLIRPKAIGTYWDRRVTLTDRIASISHVDIIEPDKKKYFYKTIKEINEN